MFRLLAILVVCALFGCITYPTRKVPFSEIQSLAMTVGNGLGYGSGILFNHKGTSYVLTAAHVLSPLRGNSSTNAFADATVVSVDVSGTKYVEKRETRAAVLNCDTNSDLGLLRILKPDFSSMSARLSTNIKLPQLGQRVIGVGSPLGLDGAGSLTDGIVSKTNRIIGDKLFIQSTGVALPGISGGGVFDEDGNLIGIISRTLGNGNFTIFIPIIEIKIWAKSNGLSYFFGGT